MQDFIDDGCEIDLNKPFIRIKAYKKSGKWKYTKYIQPLEQDLISIQDNRGFVVMDLIELGYREYYSPVGKFENYIFVIEGFNMDGFFDFILDKTNN